MLSAMKFVVSWTFAAAFFCKCERIGAVSAQRSTLSEACVIWLERNAWIAWIAASCANISLTLVEDCRL